MAEIELDEEWDFGFTSVSDEVFTQAERATTDGQQRVEAIYKLILPLLDNLAKDADKNAYIHWPGRATKIEEFKKKLTGILNG